MKLKNDHLLHRIQCSTKVRSFLILDIWIRNPKALSEDLAEQENLNFYLAKGCISYSQLKSYEELFQTGIEVA